jgi:hypothetical protein
MNIAFIRRDAVCKQKENIICSDVFKCTESNPILEATQQTEIHSTALTANCGSGQRYTACRQAKRSEWSGDVSCGMK